VNSKTTSESPYSGYTQASPGNAMLIMMGVGYESNVFCNLSISEIITRLKTPTVVQKLTLWH
jgi:hypothetical protein